MSTCRLPARILGLAALAAALSLAGCRDRALPTASAPEGGAFTQVPASPVVNSLADPGTGGCDAAECTLREAITFAESGATITFAVTGTITLAGSELTVGKDLTISGPGAGQLTVSGNNASRVFSINPGTTVAISGLTISGAVASNGGGIFNEGTLTLTHSTVSGNRANIDGGGIYNWGTLTLAHSTVSGNSAGNGAGIVNQGALTVTHSSLSGNSTTGGSGGGIYHAAGTLTFTQSTISSNSAVNGGGIFLRTSGDPSTMGTTVLNSTVSGNTASNLGGGIGIYGSGTTLTLQNSTVSGNTAFNWGGGIGNYVGLTRIVHSTITGNRGPNGGGVLSYNDDLTPTDVKGSIIWGNTTDGTTASDVIAGTTTTRYNSLGHNLIGAAGANVDFNQAFNQPGDQVNVADAKLGALALNVPGTTATHALMAGSPAGDAGTCTDHNNTPVVTDQRGVSRPQGSACDIGAFELEQAAGFVFSGFFAPVDNLPVLNKAKAGSAIPVKFSLGGDFGLEIFASGYPRSDLIACDATAPVDAVTETVSAGASSLSYDAATDQYTYVWKTDKKWVGTCRQLTLQFTDGTVQRANFQFTK